MLTAVLIDDEPDALKVLSTLLKDFTNIPIKIIGTAQNLMDGVREIKEGNPDIVFLDVDMPQKSGLEIYDYFPSPSFKVIFITAYNQYAIQAIKKSATDYILKPVNFMDLREALHKVMIEMQEKQYLLELEDKVKLMCNSEMEGKPIILECEEGFVMENTKNIEYCYADQSYSVIVTFTGKKITVAKPLKSLQEILPSNHFYRTHKSFLVNIYYIRKYVKSNNGHILMRSGTKIPVSVRVGREFIDDIKKLLPK